MYVLNANKEYKCLEPQGYGLILSLYFTLLYKSWYIRVAQNLSALNGAQFQT